jgi:hypothetical protein
MILFQHSGRKVWDVLSGIAFASYIYLVALYVDGLDESSPEVVDLIGDNDLILDSGGTWRVTSASRLVNINHVG